MVDPELVANLRGQMLETLADFSSFDRQRAYRDAVPFVHVPIELACQWDDAARHLRETVWFRDLFDDGQRKALYAFGRSLDGLLQFDGQ